MSKDVTQPPRCGARWGVAGVLCALILGIVGLLGLETHCSEPAAESGSHAVAHVPSHAGIDAHAAAFRTGNWIEPASPTSGGDLIACALFVGLVALLFAAVRARRPSASWLVPAVRGRLVQPWRVCLLSISVRTVSPLRC
ncbi:hypothetical protein GCM10029976_031520 [Kribbella albertanoniae]